MNTYFLTQETADAYLREVLQRIIAMRPVPTVLCAVTQSGISLVERLLYLIEASDGNFAEFDNVLVASIGKGPDGNLMLNDISPEELRAQHCMLLDSAVHTGGLLNDCRRKLVEWGASEISSYSLVVKRGSRHIPTMWSLMIDDVDRALFFLDAIPNNRLASGESHHQKHVTISLLEENHRNVPLVVSGVDSIDRVTWSDRLFDMQASNRESMNRTYLLEKANEVIGYLTFHMEPNRHRMSLDEVALDVKWQGQKLGGVLLRFACTLARHYNCEKIRLNAIEAKVSFYKNFGFSEIAGASHLRLDEEIYVPMEKAMLNRLLDGCDPDT